MRKRTGCTRRLLGQGERSVYRCDSARRRTSLAIVPDCSAVVAACRDGSVGAKTNVVTNPPGSPSDGRGGLPRAATAAPTDSAAPPSAPSPLEQGPPRKSGGGEPGSLRDTPRPPA